MKRSAGILTYKIEDDRLKVLLCHFGGPYWKGEEKGAWSISKGENVKGEKMLDTAKREFNEETNLEVTESINYLSSKKVNKKKLVIMFYANNDFNLDNCISNTFEIEYPRGSGVRKVFHEMDRYEWMDIDKAKEMILSNQLYFLNKLEEKLNGE